jgi:hypothetical protein
VVVDDFPLWFRTGVTQYLDVNRSRHEEKIVGTVAGIKTWWYLGGIIAPR